MLAERGITVSYETIRRWVAHFGPIYGLRLRATRPPATGRWHLDEVFISIAGRQMYLWHAVDDEGEVLDLWVQARCDKDAALRLMRQLLKGCPPQSSLTGIALTMPRGRLLPPVLDAISCGTLSAFCINVTRSDMQLCNNLTILHSRTGFEDWPEPERRRHMIRLWLTFQERRPLDGAFPSRNGYGRNQIAEAAFQLSVAA